MNITIFFITVWGIVLPIVIYMFPTIIALARKKKNVGAIFILNFLLGWTLLGWIVALIWAVTYDHK